MNIRQKILRAIAAWAVLLLFMAFLQPQRLPVVVLIVPFVLLFAAFFALWDLVAALQIKYVSRMATGSLHRRLGATISMSVVLLLVLQSLGQLTMRDVVTLLAAVLIGYLYLARNRFGTSKH